MTASATHDVWVSIITVALNAAATIKDTLESVASQRAGFRIQHICIDGGSTDGTRELISAAAALNRDLVCVFEPDKGLFDAMNKGLRMAEGTYILYLNADDFLVGNDSIANAFAALAPHMEPPDMVMGDVVMGNLDRTALWRMRRVPRWLPKLPTIGVHPPHQGNFIRRDLLLRAEGFDATERLAADTTQFYRLVFDFKASMAVTATTVAFMRMGGASNKQLSSFGKGNRETYRFLRRHRSAPAAAATVAVKILQKVFEYRFGHLDRKSILPH